MNIKCKVCEKPANLYCTGCFTVAYCGKDHQKEEWKLHKKQCIKAYTVQNDPVAGRVMVANRNLDEGDIILKERAALVGPNIDSSSKPICVGCFKSIEKVFINCSKCSLTLCSKGCEKSPLHVDECRILAQNPDAIYCKYKNGASSKRKKLPKNVNYQMILVLRGLLLNDQKMDSVLALQSHVEEREQMGKTKIVDETILPILQQYKVKDSTEEKIHTLCGIFDTNCFELFPTGAGDIISGVFPNAAMMMHSCYKNTRLMFSDDHTLTLMARCKVKKGDRLYHNYARTFNPTNIRRIGLFSGKHFSCECVRCKDPTELGTYISAFICKCSGQILASDPLDLTATAQSACNKCAKTTPTLEIAAKERNILMELESINRLDVEGFEAFINKYKTVLHSNHGFLIKAKKELSVAYGGYPGFSIQSLSDQRLINKVIYCKQLIQLCEILEPGLSTQKGLSLYELWKAVSEKNRRDFANKKVNKEDFLKISRKYLEFLEKSYRILQYEPENSLHGQVSKEIKNIIKEEKASSDVK